jgi:hypothetical protein
MSQQPERTEQPRLATSTKVAHRYNRHPRSIARWWKDPNLGFPRPYVINGRNFFDEAELDEFDARVKRTRDAGGG